MGLWYVSELAEFFRIKLSWGSSTSHLKSSLLERIHFFCCWASVPVVPVPAFPVIPENTCDQSGWPDVKVDCGGCRALVMNIQTAPGYQNCEGYCSSVGRFCKGEFEEVSNSCDISMEESMRLSCTTVFEDTNDLICQCGELKRTLRKKSTAFIQLVSILGRKNTGMDFPIKMKYFQHFMEFYEKLI